MGVGGLDGVQREEGRKIGVWYLLPLSLSLSLSLSGAEKYKDAASELLTFESCRKKVPTDV